MTQPNTDDPERLAPLAGADPAVGAVRREAFAALIAGAPVDADELARAADLSKANVEHAIAQLHAAGALELDPDGRVTGAHGLTHRQTQHAIVTPQRTWHTWCALDAVGIPAALGLDAEVHTRCPTCDGAIVLEIRSGTAIAPHDTEPMLWLPGTPCAHVMNDFCAAANLFCNREHLEVWRARAANPPGAAVTLTQAENQGRRVWADVSMLDRVIDPSGPEADHSDPSP